jgi:Trypsin-like peptidase domain
MDRDDARRLGASRHSVSHARRGRPRTSLVADRRWSSIGPWVFSLLLLLASSRAAACIDPEGLAHSTVGITRYFSDDDARVDSDLLGVRGTAWFLSATSMVTAEHVAAAMALSDLSWKQIEIREREIKQSIAVRIQRIAGIHAEKLAVLELQTQFPGAQALQIRMKPLAAEERVVSLAYPGSRLRFAGGRFVGYGDSENLAGTALLEMYDGDNRLVLDHGASGAPVLDCEGRVVAIVSNIFTQTLQLPFRAMRVSTAWGSPNVVAVPSRVLAESLPTVDTASRIGASR